MQASRLVDVFYNKTDDLFCVFLSDKSHIVLRKGGNGKYSLIGSCVCMMSLNEMLYKVGSADCTRSSEIEQGV